MVEPPDELVVQPLQLLLRHPVGDEDEVQAVHGRPILGELPLLPDGPEYRRTGEGSELGDVDLGKREGQSVIDGAADGKLRLPRQPDHEEPLHPHPGLLHH